MTTETKTAALTLNWRDAARTIRCVDSLLDQDIDFVLVWDNSADEGVSHAELIAHYAENPRVAIVLSPENLGFAAGVNRALDWVITRHPESEYALLINNDATMEPGAVAILRDALHGNPHAWLAYPNIDNDGRITGPTYYHRLTGLLTQRKLPGSFVHASGCCQLYALKNIVRPVFDEDFFMYGEDAALGWRLSHIPGSMVHVPRTLVFHEGSASSKMGSPFYEQRMVAAHFILARKLSNKRLKHALFASCRWATLSLRALLRSLRYRSIIPVETLVSGWHLANNHFLPPSGQSESCATSRSDTCSDTRSSTSSSDTPIKHG